MSKGMKTFLAICGIVVGVGIILGILGAILGGVKGLAYVENKVPWVSFGGTGHQETEKSTTGAFNSVDLENDMGTVKFIEGDKYRVEVSYNSEVGAPSMTVENNTLTIKSPDQKRGWVGLNIFGDSGYADSVIKIYYPKGKKFENVKINNDMGDVRLESLRAQLLDIDASAGDIRLDKISADHLKIDADMGDISGTGIQTGSTDIKASAGEIALTGALAGTTSVDNDMGDCTLTTTLPKSSYSIKTKLDMGDCRIDGQTASGNYVVENAAAKNHLKLECSAGDLKINFQ